MRSTFRCSVHHWPECRSPSGITYWHNVTLAVFEVANNDFVSPEMTSGLSAIGPRAMQLVESGSMNACSRVGFLSAPARWCRCSCTLTCLGRKVTRRSLSFADAF